MSLATVIQLVQFLRAIGPIIPVLYAAMNETFGTTAGVIKFDAFVEQVRGYVADVEELKPFAPILEQAIPSLQKLVTKYHAAQQQLAAPAV